MAGYSGTSLAQKLSLKPGQRAWFKGMPAPVEAEIRASGVALLRLNAPEPPVDAAHVFVTSRADLEAGVAAVRHCLAPAGFLWVSWPKKSSGVATDVTEDTFRAVALPTGLVDIKVCAVNETWSGLKLVIRKELR